MLASSPGKVLILGGYLIIQSPNVGISIGVNARFTARMLSSSSTTSPELTVVHVASPQFKQNFSFFCTTAGGVVSVVQTDGPASPFLYYAVLFGVSAAHLSGDAINQIIYIEVLADNDFYSQRNYLESQNKCMSVANLRRLPPHLPLTGAVSKTGLGSSAAMTVSLVACLCAHFHQSLDVEKELIHRIAQVAHNVSQGKIGSGFDVFTAVYGSCVYRRFSGERIEALSRVSERLDRVDITALKECLNMSCQWVQPEHFCLPFGFKLVLGDIHFGGSSTPGMVTKIMAWKKSLADDSDSLWEKLKTTNEAYVEQMRILIKESSENSQEYHAAIDVLHSIRFAEHVPQNVMEEKFIEAYRLATLSRRYLREMGVAAGVDIEPKELTELLDDTAALPGVFTVGCPGAGGYDAVFSIVIGNNGCAAVEHFWESYARLKVCSLLVREDPCGLLIEM